MVRNARLLERIGKVFLPEADSIETSKDFTPDPDNPFPIPDFPPVPGGEEPQLPIKWPPKLEWPFEHKWFLPKFCFTSLKQGCYTISFSPPGVSIFRTRFHGTLRVESVTSGFRISGDLYSYRLLDDLVVKWPLEKALFLGANRDDLSGDGAADTGGTIPIYPRRKYYSYLKGTGTKLFKVVSWGSECSFNLDFDEFVYNHPATGFNGSFNTTKTRSIRFVLRRTSTADLYSGDAFEGTTLIGSVSIRWVSQFYRRTHLQVHTLQGAETPPASVGTSTFATIFADAGWDATVTDGGTVALPAALSGVNINACWSMANLHTLMSSLPGYNPADLDSVWRVHLVSVPAALGCSRGVMFDSSLGADPNAVAREGSATFSRDGYPAGDCPDGMGGSHYDAVAGDQQRNVPRAFLRSATHEVGHAFNQIHQGFEAGNDNSIMTPTPGVATVIGAGGTFPDAINLAFNATVTRHLRHLPDPAVRPGAMDFFGSAIAGPEAADMAWLEPLAVSVDASSDHVRLGEPVELTFRLTNTGNVSIPVPATLDLESLTVRINVTDLTGRITFMRPARILSCPSLTLKELAPGKSVEGTTTLFWGRDGFAFETPGRHVVEVIVLWHLAGVPVAAAGERDIFVDYPVTSTDNEVAALLLDPEVGMAVASRAAWAFERGAKRIKQAISKARSHPASRAIAKLVVLVKPRVAARRRTRTAKARRPRRKT